MNKKMHGAQAVRVSKAFDGDPEINLEDPRVLALVAAAVDKANESVAGLVANRDALKTEKTALAEEFKKFKGDWDSVGMDADGIRKLIAAVDGEAEAQLIADGKMNEVIERRTQKMRDQYVADTEVLGVKNAELQALADAAGGRVKALVLDHAVRASILKVKGFQPGAVADAVSRASTLFRLDENEAPVAMEGDTILRGKDSTTALGVDEWLVGLTENDCKHWLVPSNGGGAGGSGDQKTGGDGESKNLDGVSSRDLLKTGFGDQS